MNNMLLNHQKIKMFNAILFFANNTKHCGKIKLFKLLYFLDFYHFSETGKSVTGLEYYAWKMGPVPKSLHEEIKHPSEEMQQYLTFEQKKTHKYDMLKINVLKSFDQSLFTIREYTIMEMLANKYSETKSEKMIEATHLENQPWHQVFEIEKKRQSIIPYDLAIKKQEKEEMRSHIKEMNEFWNSFQ